MSPQREHFLWEVIAKGRAAVRETIDSELRTELIAAMKRAEHELCGRYFGAVFSFTSKGWNSHADEVGVDPVEVEGTALETLWRCILTFDFAPPPVDCVTGEPRLGRFGGYLRKALRNELSDLVYGSPPKSRPLFDNDPDWDINDSGEVRNSRGQVAPTHPCPAHTGQGCNGDDPDRDPATSGECEMCHFAMNPNRPRAEASPARKAAADLLRVQLADGPQPASDVIQAAESVGIAEWPLVQACRELRVRRRHVGALGGHWVWELPPSATR